VDAGIDEIAENEIYNAVLAPKKHCRFGALLGQRVEPCSFTSRETDTQDGNSMHA
jgi:hypothetical protein